VPVAPFRMARVGAAKSCARSLGRLTVLACCLWGCEQRERAWEKLPPALASNVTSTQRAIAPPVVLDSVRCEPGYTAFALRRGGALCVRPAGREDRTDSTRVVYYANSVLRATLDEAGAFVGSTPYPGALLLSVHAPLPADGLERRAPHTR
jgi:hypothetical protein